MTLFCETWCFISFARFGRALRDNQEHFLEDIGAVRRRLLVVEEDTKRPVVPPLTRAQIQSIAREMASAEGQEVFDNATKKSSGQ